jgi:WD40 repeat protein
VASGSDDKTVKLWDTVTGAECATLNGHSRLVYGPSFVDDGKLLVFASSDHKLKSWQTETGTEAMEFPELHIHDDSMSCVAVSWKSKLIAYATAQNEIIICKTSEANKRHQIFEGHSSYISELTFSPDSLRLASASGDETIKIWTLATDTDTDTDTKHKADLTLEGHSGPVNTIAFSLMSDKFPDNLLASGSDDHTIIIWDWKKKEDVRRRWILVGHTGPVNSVAFSPNGRLASASDDGMVRLWNVRLGISYGILSGHSSWVRSVSFSSSGDQLASASDDCTVKIWDVEMGMLQRGLNEHSDVVTVAAFPPPRDLKWYASACSDKTIKIWDRDTATVFATLEGHSGAINCISISPNGSFIASASDDQTVRIWNAHSPDNVPKNNNAITMEADMCHYDHKGSVTCVVFLPDGKHVASSSSNGTVILWDVNIQTGKKQEIMKHKKTVRTIAVSLNKAGDLLIASASNDETVQLRRSKGEDVFSALSVETLNHKDWVRAIAFSPKGEWLASGSDDKFVRVWNIANPKTSLIEELEGSDWIRSLEFSSDSKLLVSGSDDGTVRVWDTNNWKKCRVLTGHEGCINTISVSQDSKFVVSASNDKTIRVWDIETEESTLFKHSDRVGGAVFSPDGHYVVSVSDDRTVKLWDAERQDLFTAPEPGPITQIEFSSTKKVIATLSGTKEIRLWDLEGSPHRTLRGHSRTINCISFSVDGELLVSGSDDQTVKLWSTARGQEKPIHTFRGHLDAVGCIAFFSSSGKKIIASGSHDNTVRLWNAETSILKLMFTSEGEKGHLDSINSIAFSSDGVLVASASNDRKVIVSLVETGKQKYIFEHSGQVSLVTFLEDRTAGDKPVGYKIATASLQDIDTYKVSLWETDKKSPYESIESFKYPVTAISISRLGKSSFVATASSDNMIRVWPHENKRFKVALETIKTDGPIRELAFSPNGSYLCTDRGYLKRGLKSLPPVDSLGPISQLYVNTKWITRDTVNGTQIIGIPDDYKPFQVYVHETFIILGHDSGNISILKFDSAKIS